MIQVGEREEVSRMIEDDEAEGEESSLCCEPDSLSWYISNNLYLYISNNLA